jgi:hypothetical protein
MKKIWINKADSFKASEKFDAGYYLEMTLSERLETVQLLREEYSKIHKKKGGPKDEIAKGLRRVIRVIQ